MMIQLFAVFDAVAERYVDPFCAPNVGIAVRGFEEACGTGDHQFRKHPEDYSLWLVGEFDPELGILTGQAPVKIAIAISFVGRDAIGPEPEQMTPYKQLDLLDGENGTIKEIA